MNQKGMTRKKFIGEGIEKNASGSDEETEDDLCISGPNEEDIKGVDSLHLIDQLPLGPKFLVTGIPKHHTPNGSQLKHGKENRNHASPPNAPPFAFAPAPTAGTTTLHRRQPTDENDERQVKSLNKQRKYAVSAARRGQKSIASRNSYKDKGRRSDNSKIQKQLCGL
ncbi:hypothetical protein L484_013651 [Morus notabilis]|uniref:Uncharacterized protein n=1 Tax=Morus notabilis TaxID=981085 RepID=W9QM58_9ROSA|nr:hypothetical protein L484_013651 [Morus notabilis]